MMEFDHNFSTIRMNLVNHLPKRLYLIIVRESKLAERSSARYVINPCYLGYYQTHSALCTLDIMIFHSLGDSAVKLTEAHTHGCHNYSVFNFEVSYLNRRKKHIIIHNQHSSTAVNKPAAKDGRLYNYLFSFVFSDCCFSSFFFDLY